MRPTVDAVKLIGCLVVTLGTGFVGSLSTRSGIDTWYASLSKPVFTPPGWIFAPAWTALYVMMGIAAYLVLRQGLRQPGVAAALVAFAAQLGLNLLWSMLFFGKRQPLWGLADIAALWVMIVVTMVLFFRVSKPAGWLFVPYLAWVSFASVLNYEIWRLNR